ncbi:hypothetical protein ACFVZ3_36605 [Kitasatospora purpeofusca]|uniref:hypothetical protein n=1 Tax=Kitasatospora purpeofusca TaxID=67352 RepID=UPI0036ACD282
MQDMTRPAVRYASDITAEDVQELKVFVDGRIREAYEASRNVGDYTWQSQISAVLGLAGNLLRPLRQRLDELSLMLFAESEPVAVPSPAIDREALLDELGRLWNRLVGLVRDSWSSHHDFDVLRWREVKYRDPLGEVNQQPL